jgi:hypothetical protein
MWRPSVAAVEVEAPRLLSLLPPQPGIPRLTAISAPTIAAWQVHTAGEAERAKGWNNDARKGPDRGRTVMENGFDVSAMTQRPEL